MKAIVLGETGGVGRELVKSLVNSPNYSKIFLPVRRTLEDWNSFTEEQKAKMEIIIEENFDFLGGSKEELEKKFGTEEINSLFDCLGGSYMNNESLQKIDKEYAIYCAEICEKLNISHFSIISTNKASPDSSSFYNRIKGEADEEVLKKNIKYIDIYRPGIILGRPNAGCLEKFVGSFVCCFANVTAQNLAKAMMIKDIKIINPIGEKTELNEGYKKIIRNAEINDIAENNEVKF